MAFMEHVSYELKNTEVGRFKMPFKRFPGYEENFWSLLPDNIEEHLQGLKNTEIREDDVFICTYPRSGTNWANEIVKMVINGNDKYIDYFLDFFDMLPTQQMQEMTSPRIFVSHLPFRFLPTQLSDKGRVICVFRNPKDVAVSFYNWTKDISFAEFDGSFDEYLRLFYNGNVPSGCWFDHVRNWESVINGKLAKNLLYLYYEEMKKDLKGTVEKIANFLDVRPSPELITNISLKCGFTKMAEEKRNHIPDVIKLFSKDGSNYLYRKGAIGDWKNWFTVAQSEEFDRYYEKQMKDSRLVFAYECKKEKENCM